jgi:hypothetical protein
MLSTCIMKKLTTKIAILLVGAFLLNLNGCAYMKEVLLADDDLLSKGYGYNNDKNVQKVRAKMLNP